MNISRRRYAPIVPDEPQRDRVRLVDAIDQQIFVLFRPLRLFGYVVASIALGIFVVTGSPLASGFGIGAIVGPHFVLWRASNHTTWGLRTPASLLNGRTIVLVQMVDLTLLVSAAAIGVGFATQNALVIVLSMLIFALTRELAYSSGR